MAELAAHEGPAEQAVIMEKTLTASDVGKKSRMVMPAAAARRLALTLTPGELAAAERGGGLDVRVFLRNRWWLRTQLAAWPSTGAMVLRGREYREVVVLGALAAGTRVRLSAYRSADSGDLCFDLLKVA